MILRHLSFSAKENYGNILREVKRHIPILTTMKKRPHNRTYKKCGHWASAFAKAVDS